MRKPFLFMLIVTLSFALLACRRSAKEYVIDDPRLEAVMIDDHYRVFYQIFVGSFSDASGDGHGDIQGIINRLDYLNDGDPNSGKSLGVTGIWLTPIMPSPTYHKYDTTDYMAIDPAFGTLDDFRELVEEANARGINIIIDLVLNHTSTQHPWFQAAKAAAQAGEWDNPYLEYYTLVTDEEKVAGRQYYHFHGDLYYEGNFWSQMPELNFDSALVRAEFETIVAFWLDDVGVDGFRLDAVKYPYYNDHEANLEMWAWFMDVVTSVREDAYVVGEMWDSDTNIFDYYQVFNNFDFSMSQNYGEVAMTARGEQPVNDFVNRLFTYKQSVKAVNPNATLQPFIANHDMDRPAGYLSVADYRMHMAANLYILTYGTPFIYYGEEIGMRGMRAPHENTDANRRLAMLWGDRDTVEDPIGTTWDPNVQPNGTVQDQIGDRDSLYTHYKQLIMLRHANPEIARGEYTPLVFDGYFTFGGFLSTWQGSTVGVFHNTGENPISVDLSSFTDIDFTAIRGAVGRGTAVLEGSTLTLDGLTSVVLRAEE